MLQAVGAEGTLVVPTQTWRNLDPSTGVHTLSTGQPIPEAWWDKVREQYPVYQADLTPSVGMGAVAEMVRTWPSSKRSPHPARSFAAVGKHAADICRAQPLDSPLGENSPLAKLYSLNAYTLLLGVGHDRNTALHLAESRAVYSSKKTLTESSAVLVNGVRKWQSYSVVAADSDDFEQLGAAFDRNEGIKTCDIGRAKSSLLNQRRMVDFAVGWLEKNR